MKRVWMKLESDKKGFTPYYNIMDLEDDIEKLLKNGPVEVKFGQGNHYYIDDVENMSLVIDAVGYYMA